MTLELRPIDLMDIVPLGTLVLEAINVAPSALRGPGDLPDSPLLVGEEMASYDEEALRPLVADLGGALAGFAAFERRAMMRSDHVVDLRLLVHPAARGQGVGERLLQEAMRQVGREPLVGKLVLRVASDDQPLLHLVHRHPGWRREQIAHQALARGSKRVELQFWAHSPEEAGP